MRKAFLLGAALALGACGPTVSSTQLASAPPRTADHEILLFSAKLPSCGYDEIGLVSVEPGWSSGSDQGLLTALKRQAARMGGDAVVGLAQSRVAGSDSNASSSTVLSGTVIRFTDPQCRK